MDRPYKILWVDDEIELLKSQILLLQNKGFIVIPAASGEEALAKVKEHDFDLVLLDEMMPGMDGLATLAALRQLRPELSAIMATKNEKEELVEQALGQKIDDFLLKPLNPAQVLASCRRVLESRHLVEGQASREYLTQLNNLRNFDYPSLDWQGWCRHYQMLTEWDLRLSELPDQGLHQSHEDITKEANLEFGRFIEENYIHWLHGSSRPILSTDLVERYLLPIMKNNQKCLLLILDCMRLDQWLLLEPYLKEWFDIKRDHYYSILPTATPYSRNSIFSGLYPSQLAKNYPQYWEKGGHAGEASLNRHEHKLLELQLQRLKVPHPADFRYSKIYNIDEGHELKKVFGSWQNVPLAAVVVNFMDILVHSRAESLVLQEIAPDEKAFRSLTRTWFANSDVLNILQQAARQKRQVIVTTDHGSLQGRRATIIQAGRDTSANLRYKSGTNISCDPRQVLWIKKPLEYMLPEDFTGLQYLVAKEDYYLVYPTKYEEYRKRYEGTFQHGGISMEEMILPVCRLTPK
jgi:CheY-like chemotaxis protein